MAETRFADMPRIARRSSATTVGRSRMISSKSLETFLFAGGSSGGGIRERSSGSPRGIPAAADHINRGKAISVSGKMQLLEPSNRAACTTRS
jgi:hypothetical protein